MVPNCEGCKQEIEEAYIFQELGCNVALEGMGIKGKHVFFTAFDKKGKWVAG